MIVEVVSSSSSNLAMDLAFLRQASGGMESGPIALPEYMLIKRACWIFLPSDSRYGPMSHHLNDHGLIIIGPDNPTWYQLL